MRCLLALTFLLTPIAGLAVAKPEQIRSDQSPVFHYYLQAYPKDKTIPVLGPAATGEYFNIAGSIQSTNTSMYLEIGSDSTSYKTLKFSNSSSTKAWGLEGDTIITTTSSSFGRRKV
jgi:SOS-response transcriptional repressor LexA